MEDSVKDFDLNISMDELVKFRRDLHKHPEIAHKEEKTAERVLKFIQNFEPDEIIDNIGGHGLAAVFKGKEEGPVIMFRCELDALPIEEVNEFDYKSVYDGFGHKCGHDGHMTIISGLASVISSEKPSKGKVILLYQPAEEKGEGAAKILNDPQFDSIKPDYIFALHNLPGFPKNQVIIKEETFAAASKGMIISLKGKTSHAGQPENGNSPVLAMAALMEKLTNLPGKITDNKDLILVTVIHAKLGEVRFGTTPGKGKVMATLRAFLDDDLEVLCEEAIKLAETEAEKYNLKLKIEWTEEFHSTINDPECIDIIREVAKEQNIRIEEREKPFRWCEDFGLFTATFKGALFGLGAGKDTPQLHNPDYDFPEELIEGGIRMFSGIMKKILYK